MTRAMAEPRDVDMELVEAYLARRALDYLVGFTLSPVLVAQAARREIRRPRAVGSRSGSSSTARWEIEAFRAANTGRCARCFETPRGQSFRGAAGGHGRKEARPLRPRHRGPRRGLRSRPCHPARSPSPGWRPSPPRATPRPPPFHDLDPPAGSEPQVRHGRQADDERGPSASTRQATSPTCGPTASTWRPEAVHAARDCHRRPLRQDYVPRSSRACTRTRPRTRRRRMSASGQRTCPKAPGG